MGRDYTSTEMTHYYDPDSGEVEEGSALDPRSIKTKSVTIRLTPAVGRIELGVLNSEAINALSEGCSYEVQGAEHMKRSGKYGRGRSEWDGKKRLYHKGHRTFGAGLLSRVTAILENHGFVPNVEFEPPASGRITLPTISTEWLLRPYQRSVVISCIESQRGMVQVATGGGKTVIAGHLIKALSTNTVFFVHTKDLLYQALETFTSMFGSDMVGQVGDGIVSPKAITVCTLQTAAKFLEVKYETDSFAEGDETWKDVTDLTGRDQDMRRMLDHAGLLIMDECHRVAAPTATEVVLGVKNAAYRFGMSASPWRDDGADMALEAVFGEVIAEINASELIDMGFLVAPVIRMKAVEPARFDKKAKYSEIYSQYIVENPYRNALVCADAYHKLQRGIQTMILVRHIKHGELIRQHMADLNVAAPFLSGKDTSDLRRQVIRDMRDEKTPLLIATTIADEGLDIKPLRGLVLAGGGKSSTRALQRVGRVLRPFAGKTSAEVTDFEDNCRILFDHSKARVKMYETERRFTITDL